MEQLTLFDVDEQAEEDRKARDRAYKIDQAADAVRDRFGYNAIQRGSVMQAGVNVAKRHHAAQEANIAPGDCTTDYSPSQEVLGMV